MIKKEKRKIIMSLRKYCLSHRVESRNKIGCVPIIPDEIGHSCGLVDVSSGIDRVMYKTTEGNETLLTDTEATAFED